MGMISAAVEAVTAESAQRQIPTHVGREPATAALKGPWSYLAFSLQSHSLKGSNTYHKLCKPPEPSNPAYSYAVKDSFMFRPSFLNKPGILQWLLYSWH